MRPEEMMAVAENDRKVLMTGNEAMVRGAIEAGLSIGAGYPGTPSSEILEDLSRVADRLDLYVEWSTNEKVAFEVAYGGSMTGLRTLVTMKHEGGNVIVDSLSKMVYTGVKGGFLVITCDDPGAYSSSNEQDNRLLAQFVDMPVLEPSTPQEAKDMVAQGLEISEKYLLPIMVRSVTRLSHGKSKVALGPLQRLQRTPYFDRHDEIEDRWFCCAFNHLDKHRRHHAAMQRFKDDYLKTSAFNRTEGDPNSRWGIVTSGIAYNIIKEGLRTTGLEKDVALLKLGFPYPLAEGICLDFMRGKEKILVLEESEPCLENQIRVLAQMNGLAMPIHGQMSGDLERPGEMTFERALACLQKVFEVPPAAVAVEDFRTQALDNIKARPLTMCSGCPHRATHMALAKALKKLKIKKPIVFGDIGCYELGHEPPFCDMDSIYNMGAGVGLANGLAQSGVKEPVLALIGDSTLLHSGLPGFVNAVHGKANITMIVFDNATIAMTGHQPPVSCTRTLMGFEAPGFDIAGALRAAQASYVAVTDAFDIGQTQKAIQEAIQTEGPSAVIVQGPCALEHDRVKRHQGIAVEPYTVDVDRCIGCRTCTTKFGCPAMIWNADTEKVSVDPFVCNGCGVCVQICPKGAFGKEKQA